ncbi:hypothetical protein CEE44_04875 [Candidatus Woesearchaeota archaeon B3_Woes]|nr:MAG: hypothetical protein CEE44_04875 [Candidatus Woesearchaeota archaeon B3_Woes]
MLIDTLTEPMSVGDRWTIETDRKKSKEMADAHKLFYEDLVNEGLYHPDTKISIVVKDFERVQKFQVYALEAHMPDLIQIPDEKEILALDVKTDLYKLLFHMNPNVELDDLLNHPVFECLDSIKYDEKTDKMYLTTLLLFMRAFPHKFILEQHKKQTGEDLVPYHRRSL